jgi:sugar lactone lactonase YvrE
MNRIMAIALVASMGCSKDDDATTDTSVEDTGSTLATNRVPFVWETPEYCSSIPAPPYETSRIFGFTGAEDFAFDLDGNYVATDDSGNIVRIDMDGNLDLWSPQFGESTGTTFMPDGTLAIGSYNDGQVVQVFDNGATNRLVGGLSYPNGVTVDMWGRVYVADQDQGKIIRYDPVLDEKVTLADGLFNPNGLTLAPDQNTLYVGSFGGGTIHSIDLTAEDTTAVLFGETPVIETTDTATDENCAGKVAGDECFLDDPGVGSCVENAYGGLFCDNTVDTLACDGMIEGDACSTTALGADVDSVCATRTTTGDLFCPKVPAEVVTACVGLDEDDPCTALGIDRNCRWSWEDVLVCDTTPWNDVSEEACVGLNDGDDCVIVDYEGFTAGICGEGWGGGDLTCEPDWYSGYGGYSYSGGLDGVIADACGYVWVTEYTLGLIWRFSPDGSEVEMAVDTESFWIPNLHFGLGVGGFEKDALYIQDRWNDSMLVVHPGVQGGPVPYSPEYAPAASE